MSTRRGPAQLADLQGALCVPHHFFNTSFGTITLHRIHLIILVSRCESVRITCILLTCDLLYPSLLLSLCVRPKSSPLKSLRQGMHTGLRSAGHLLPTSIETYRIHLIFATYNYCALFYVRYLGWGCTRFSCMAVVV